MLPSHVRYYLHTKSFYVSIVVFIFLASVVGNIYFANLVASARTSSVSHAEAGDTPRDAISKDVSGGRDDPYGTNYNPSTGVYSPAQPNQTAPQTTVQNPGSTSSTANGTATTISAQYANGSALTPGLNISSQANPIVVNGTTLPSGGSVFVDANGKAMSVNQPSYGSGQNYGQSGGYAPGGANTYPSDNSSSQQYGNFPGGTTMNPGPGGGYYIEQPNPAANLWNGVQSWFGQGSPNPAQ